MEISTLQAYQDSKIQLNVSCGIPCFLFLLAVSSPFVLTHHILWNHLFQLSKSLQVGTIFINFYTASTQLNAWDMGAFRFCGANKTYGVTCQVVCKGRQKNQPHFASGEAEGFQEHSFCPWKLSESHCKDGHLEERRACERQQGMEGQACPMTAEDSGHNQCQQNMGGGKQLRAGSKLER